MFSLNGIAIWFCVELRTGPPFISIPSAWSWRWELKNLYQNVETYQIGREFLVGHYLPNIILGSDSPTNVFFYNGPMFVLWDGVDVGGTFAPAQKGLVSLDFHTAYVDFDRSGSEIFAHVSLWRGLCKGLHFFELNLKSQHKKNSKKNESSDC